MLMCMDCKSNNIVEVEHWQGYFREGEYIRLRTITILENKNDGDLKGFISYSTEHSIVVNAIGNTKLESITKLAKLLKAVCHVELIDKYLEEE